VADDLKTRGTQDRSCISLRQEHKVRYRTNALGVSKEGVSKEGVSKEGVSKEGVSKEGVSKEGVSKEGVSKEGLAATVACFAREAERSIAGRVQSAWLSPRDDILTMA
jgi:hypothetical protein